jgi:acyl-CoA reductase-like NAD-dependent aldehyde dehydrogenase
LSPSSGVPHFPVLRAGKEYESLDRVELKSHRDGTVVASVSQANAGIIKRDMRKLDANAAKLRAMPMAERIERCQEAARIFLEDELPIGEGSTQTADEFVDQLSSTSGLPHNMVRANMRKNAFVLSEVPTVLRGLMRGMDPSVLDEGFGHHDGVPVWYTPSARALGAVLPSNSPGVHSLWIPSIVLGVPLVLKPGREEPWTPMRVARAMMKAGFPPEAFSLYPTDHEGAGTLLEHCDRSLLFGDARVAAKYAGDPRIEIHGPGRSKVLIGDDVADDWESFLDVYVDSVAKNGGRSCINASAIYTPRHGDRLAEALAARLAEIEPRPYDDPGAGLAAFANPAFADMMSAAVDAGIEKGGARDVTMEARGGSERRAELGCSVFLRPTVVRCDSMEHPLANTEYMFPFTSVVEVPQEKMLEVMGPSLVVTAITKDGAFLHDLTTSPLISRLNVGPVPTSTVEWDQPHEGNLFEFLYERRALQRAAGW